MHDGVRARALPHSPARLQPSLPSQFPSPSPSQRAAVPEIPMSNIQQFISILELKIDPKLTAQPESWHFNDLLDLRQDERVSAMIYPVFAGMSSHVRITKAGVIELDMSDSQAEPAGDIECRSFVIVLDMRINTEATAEPGDWDFASLLDLHGDYSLEVTSYEISAETVVRLHLTAAGVSEGGIEPYVSMTSTENRSSLQAQSIADFLPSDHLEALRLLGQVIGIMRERATQAPDEVARMAEAIQAIPEALAGDNGTYHLPTLTSRARALIAAHSSTASVAN